ncbi:MAG: hypothetical protein Q7U87_00960 [bacterium]|nr:hypothetical protein [bacterium]
MGRTRLVLGSGPRTLVLGMLPSRLSQRPAGLGGWPLGLGRSVWLVRLGPLSLSRGSLGPGRAGGLMALGPAPGMICGGGGYRFPMGLGLMSGRGRSVVLNRLGRGLFLAFEKA